MRPTDDETKHSGGSRGSVPVLRVALIAGMVVLSAVLAGCSGVPFLGGGSSGPNVNAADEIKQKLSVSPGTIYQRVEKMVGMQDPEYPNIEVVYQGINQDMDKNSTATFLKTVVGTPPSRTATRAEVEHTYHPPQNVIRINISAVRQNSAARLQTIIAGEFFRAYMYQQNWSSYNVDTMWLDGPITDLGDSDGFMPQTLISGAINYLQSAYAEQHLDQSVNPAPAWGSGVGTYEKWFALDRSRIGMQYFQGTLDSPAGLTEFFSGDIPVRTTEQVLHDDADEPKELSIDVTTDDWWRVEQPSVQGPGSSLLVDPRDPRGELGVRYVLQSQLSTSRANQAARGWGTDAAVSLTSFYANESAGVVWGLKWDSASEADQFVNAMETYIEGRTSQNDDVQFTVDRPDETTVVVFAGDQGFYRHVSYEIQGNTIAVSAGT